MTDNVDAADALNADIDAAKAAGDMGKANELYRRQMGVGDDPYGVEAPAPAVSDDGGDPPAQTSPGELTVATGADDETVTVSGGMDFANNPEHIGQALEAMSWWDSDEAGEPDGDRVSQLKAKWGSDMGANLAHFQAFALAHPDIYEVLDAAGFGDHPAIVEAGAMLGRKYATVAGDPGQITTRKAGAKTMDSMATNQIEARIEAIRDDIDKAQARQDTTKANKLYQEALGLEALLPGGTDPIIGQAGRSV